MFLTRYKYEMHCHTSTSSHCSKFSPKEIVDFYVKRGYDGVFITDHLRRTDNISDVIKGYYEVKKHAEGTNLKVFFGIELSFNDAHFLVYGLKPEDFLNHPEIQNASNLQAIKELRKHGATVIQAHPYRITKSISRFELYPYDVDGVELYNSANYFIKCPLTKKYAKLFKLPVTAGSDIHSPNREILSQFITNAPINSETDYINFLKSKKYKIKTVKNKLAKKHK